MIEQMLADLVVADARWQMGVLRYFNPVGAHESGEIGEEPRGIPNNLMPVIAEVAAGWLPVLNVFGDDWPTPDGTAVRDYIHVMDLADAHAAAVRRLLYAPAGFTVNLGTGKGVSVLEMVRAFEQASGRKHPSACRATPARRCRRVLCRRVVGRGAARLARTTPPSADVRRRFYAVKALAILRRKGSHCHIGAMTFVARQAHKE